MPQIGAPAAWQRGYTGKGVKVAVLDTGIDKTHPDLRDRVAAEANFSDSTDAVDRDGHGTHVASTIAGSGAASEGKYRGVAPDATLLNAKVLDDGGFGSDSGIIAGMEWATAQGAKVLNLSLGGWPSDGTDPLSQAVDALTRQTGALFVVAAGNCFSSDPGQISAPGAADLALTVGSLERDGAVSDFSCRGPRVLDGSLKPEISAPGSGIVAARAAGTEAGDPVNEHYVSLSGTSMATPHVTGTAALLAQRHADWTGEQLRSQLISTADPQHRGKVPEQGAGRVDADQATDSALTVDTGELDYGYLKWPHPNPAPVTKKLTYRNAASAAVTLKLESRADDGSSPVRLSAAEVVVPANGAVSVDVTAEFGGATGLHSGRVVATPADGDPLVSTYGWYLESEMYELTLLGVDLDGSKPDAYVQLAKRGGDIPLPTNMVDGRMTVRVPPGSYTATSVFVSDATETAPDTLTLVSEPTITVTTMDVTATLDARKAKPADVQVKGKSGLTTHSLSMDLAHKNPDGSWLTRAGFEAVGEHWRVLATPTAAAPDTDLYNLAIGARLQLPPYQARTADGAKLMVSDVPYAPRFTGVKTLVPVDAGTAAPDDLAGDRVRGKLAVIRRTVEAEQQQTLAAEQAGAAAVLFFDQDRPGLARAVFQRPSGVTVPVLATDRKTAGVVLAQTKPLRIIGLATSPYVYDAAGIWSGRIPADPAIRKRQSDFAAVQEDFGLPGKAAVLLEGRFGYWKDPLQGSVSSAWPQLLPLPLRRTAYLAGSMTWLQEAYLTDRTFERDARWYNAPRLYRGGERVGQRWFAPVATSGLPEYLPEDLHLVSQVSRDQYGLMVAIAPFAHEASHTEEFPYTLFGIDGTYEVVIRRNGTEVGRATQPASWYDVPAEAADYQITMDAQRDREWWQYSTQVKSSWSFRSKGGESELMPMIVADIDVPSANRYSQVKTGRPTQINLTLRHQTRTSTAAFTKAKLELSYDGKTWTTLPLHPTTNNSYTTTITHPTTQAGTSPHLRLEATDTTNAHLTQQITHAYGLTK